MQLDDLDNTQDSFANTTRRLKAELRQTGLKMGQQLLPAVSGVLPLLSKLAQDILPLVTGFQQRCSCSQRILRQVWR